ncbi:MAG: hypothetical protein E3J21_21405, partial [Anaerolineales bacterium]
SPFVTFAPFRGFRVSESPADKELCQRQIEATDWQIDALVYELYGLTEEEITYGEERGIAQE